MSQWKVLLPAKPLLCLGYFLYIYLQEYDAKKRRICSGCGFDEDLTVCFNDVDFCLKIREKEYLIVYIPYAGLYHHEPLNSGYEDNLEKQARFLKEVEYVRGKRGHVLDEGDLYYNPNLTLDKVDFLLKM